MGSFSVLKAYKKIYQKGRQHVDSGRWAVGHDRDFGQHPSKPQTSKNATFENHCFRIKHLLLLPHEDIQ